MYSVITAEQVEEAIFKEPDIHAVYITSPSYEGFIANYKQIKRVCGSRLLIVDEAHGAIQYFSGDTPPAALHDGADISIISMHKSLGCLIGTSLINVSEKSNFPNKQMLDAY